jgi:ribonuclease T1
LTRRPLIALVALVVILVVGYAVDALRDDGRPSGPGPSTAAATTASGVPSRPAAAGAVPLSGLPVEARRTVALIQAGGPYPYARDGVVFGNAERRLPVDASGYYREYTVTTPGESDRGARRIIVGNGGEFYYTADHYETFVRVDVAR